MSETWIKMNLNNVFSVCLPVWNRMLTITQEREVVEFVWLPKCLFFKNKEFKRVSHFKISGSIMQKIELLIK